MTVIGERILVKYVPKYKGGIIIPDSIDLDKVTEGEIVEIGNLVKGGNFGCEDLEIGDRIKWNAYAGTWADFEGQKLCIIRPSDVVCKLEKKSELALN